LKTTEEKDELMKELRWHYKQFVRTSKRKKEKQVDVRALRNYIPANSPDLIGIVPDF